MKPIGSTLMFVGAFAIVLDFLGRVPSILMWIYKWGAGPAWLIKIALLGIGAFLYFKSKDDVDV